MKILFVDRAREATISSTNESLSYPASNLADVFLNRPYLASGLSDVIEFDAGEDIPIDSVFLGYCNSGFVLLEVINAAGQTVYSEDKNVRRPIETIYFTQVLGRIVRITADISVDGVSPWVFGYRASDLIARLQADRTQFQSRFPDNPAIADGGDSAYTAVGGTWASGTFTKTAGAGFGNASLKSNGTLGTGARISFFPGLTTKEFAIGFNETLSGAVATLDYALRFDTAGNVTASESGVSTALGTYLTTDKFNIFYDGHTIDYLKNGTSLRTVTVGSGKVYYLDSDWNTNGATANTVMFRVGGILESQDAWVTTGGWSPVNATTISTTAVPGALRIVFGGATSQNNQYVAKTGMTAFTRGQAGVCKVRVRRIVGTASSFRVYNAASTFVMFQGSYTVAQGEWQELDMAIQSSWSSYTGTGTSLRMYVNGAVAGDTWDVDFFYVGDGIYVLDSSGNPRVFVDGTQLSWDSATSNIAFFNSIPLTNLKIKGVGFGAIDQYVNPLYIMNKIRNTSTTVSRSPGGQTMRNVGPVFRGYDLTVPALSRASFRTLDDKLSALGTGYPTYFDINEDPVDGEDPIYAVVSDTWTPANRNQSQDITFPILEAK